MTLKIVKISSLEGTVLGSIKLNGPNGTKLQRAKIENPYREWLTNMKLLTKGKDYFPLSFEDYLSRIRECLKEYTNEEVLVEERILSHEKEMLLRRYYSQR